MSKPTSKNILFLLLIILSLFLSPTSSSSCSSSSDCNGVERCISNQCQRLKLSENYDYQLFIGTFIMFVGAMLAAGGGLGGGGIFVPVYILIVGLEPKEAVPLSQATIFGGSIVNMVMNYPLRNPLIPSRPLIDYNAVLMLEPMLLAGTIVGVLLNIIFPSWLIVVSLALTLVYASRRTVRKGIGAWKKETLDRQRQRMVEADTDTNASNSVNIELTQLKEEEEGEIVAIDKVEEEEEDTCSNVNVVIDSNDSDSVDSLDSLDRNTNTNTNTSNGNRNSNRNRLNALLYWEDHPWVQMILIMLVWVVVSLFSLLRGGGSKDSIVGVETCSPVYWVLTFLSFGVLACFTYFIGAWLLATNSDKHALGWNPVEGEIDWNGRNTKIYPVFAMVAGCLGGLLGIGGGMILGPLLLEIGMKSRAVSTTSAAAVFITASSAALQFVVLDVLLYDYALWFFCFGVLATVLGQTLINYLVVRFNRSSFIVLSIATVIALATVMLLVSGVFTVMQDARDGNLGFESLCG